MRDVFLVDVACTSFCGLYFRNTKRSAVGCTHTLLQAMLTCCAKGQALAEELFEACCVLGCQHSLYKGVRGSLVFSHGNKSLCRQQKTQASHDALMASQSAWRSSGHWFDSNNLFESLGYGSMVCMYLYDCACRVEVIAFQPTFRVPKEEKLWSEALLKPISVYTGSDAKYIDRKAASDASELASIHLPNKSKKIEDAWAILVNGSRCLPWARALISSFISPRRLSSKNSRLETLQLSCGKPSGVWVKQLAQKCRSRMPPKRPHDVNRHHAETI